MTNTTQSVTIDVTQLLQHYPVLKLWTAQVNLFEQNATISAKDLDLIHVVDTADEAVAIMDDFYSNYLLKPNF